MRTNLFLFSMILILGLLLISCDEDSTSPDNNGENVPIISSVGPEIVTIGQEITILGFHFGSSQGASKVSINEIEITEYLSWYDMEIRLTVPENAVSGKISVVVNGEESNEIDFFVSPPSAGYYATTTIGNQVWMRKNLVVYRYRNGDPIPLVTNADKWASLTTGARCYYNNYSPDGRAYGILYNWYAVNDSRGLAPEGWHIPSDEEWKEMEKHLGMPQSEADDYGYRGYIGGKLKGSGTYNYIFSPFNWYSPNTDATNSSGFSALPGGTREIDGKPTSYFFGIRKSGVWWTSTSVEHSSDPTAWIRSLSYIESSVFRFPDRKENGNYIRCVKD